MKKTQKKISVKNLTKSPTERAKDLQTEIDEYKSFIANASPVVTQGEIDFAKEEIKELEGVLEKLKSQGKAPGKSAPKKYLKTKVFLNTDIYVSAQDYILGGFEKADLEKIEIEEEGDPLELFKIKLKMIFQERISKALSAYEREIAKNMMDGDDAEPDEDLLKESFSNDIKNMFDTYLGVRPYNLDMDSLTDQLISHPVAHCWLNDIFSRVNTESLRGDIDENKITVEEAEDYTYNTTLEQIFEQLCSLNR